MLQFNFSGKCENVMCQDCIYDLSCPQTTISRLSNPKKETSTSSTLRPV